MAKPLAQSKLVQDRDADVVVEEPLSGVVEVLMMIVG